MSDAVIILSSGDEADVEKEVKEKCQKSEGKRKNEDALEPSRKRMIKTVRVGNVENSTKKENATLPASSDEFIHDEVFNEFVGTCLELDSSGNMKTIIEKKLKRYYSLLVPEYRASEQFVTFLERKRTEMQRSPSQRYMHLREVVDELNVHRADKMQVPEKKVSDQFVRKLCKAMELLHRKIKKLEEREVDWDDEEDSAYIQLQRYRERLIKIHHKLQEVEGNTSGGLRNKISFSGTQFSKVNRAIEKFVNTKAEFPDYRDIYDLLKRSYETEGIEVSPRMLKCEAKSVFQTVGTQLQKIRRNEFWDAHSSFLQEDIDPADEDETLRNALDENQKQFQKSIDEVINTYAEKSTKSQFALEEDSNSSETVMKKESSNRDHAENDKEDEEEDEDKEEEDKEDDDNEDDDNEDDDEDEEQEKNAMESIDDIVNNIEDEDTIDESSEQSKNVFLYCGPVSPPTPFEEHSNSSSLSPLPSPGFGTSYLVRDQTENNGDVEFHSDENSGDISGSKVKTEPVAGCSKWDDSEMRDEKSISNNEINEPDVKIEEPKHTFLKVKSFANLKNTDTVHTPEEILLD